LTVGLDRPSNQSLRVALEDRYLTKQSGEGEEYEGERENRMMVRAQLAPGKSFVAQVEIPYYLWREHTGPDGTVDDTAHGLGDLQLTGRYELIRTGGFVPRHVLALTGGLKMPTGANDRLGGDDPHLQLGSGSWDPSAGLWYTFGDHPWTWYAGSTFRWNTRNQRGYKYGDVLYGTAGVRRAFFDQTLLISVEAQARQAGYDNDSTLGNDPNSGGFLAYATVGAAVAVLGDMLIRAQVQVPVVARLNGRQTEHPVGFAGLSWDFAL
jgi:hypothetical protein